MPHIDSATSWTRSVIRELAVNVKIGVHSWEKLAPQRLLVTVELYSHGHHEGQDLTSVVDYDPIRDRIHQWPDRPHQALIEPLLEELAALAFADGRVEACFISITKPDVFDDAKAAGVEIFRRRADQPAPASGPLGQDLSAIP